MRLIDADELMEHVWRDKLDSRAEIAKMVNNAHTVKDIPTKEDAEPIVDMDATKAFMIGILLGFDQKHDEIDKFKEDIKRIFVPEQNTDVLDKIRAEIEQEYNLLRSTRADETLELGECLGLKMSLKIIDKYKSEGSDPG